MAEGRMTGGPYRSLPVVQTRRAEVSSCRTCKYELSMWADDRRRIGCDRDHWTYSDDEYHSGRCPRYVATFWVRLQQLIGLRDRAWYDAVMGPAPEFDE